MSLARRFLSGLSLPQVYPENLSLSHGAIFLATCNAILLLVNVKLANTRFHHSLLIYILNITNIRH